MKTVKSKTLEGLLKNINKNRKEGFPVIGDVMRDKNQNYVVIMRKV